MITKRKLRYILIESSEALAESEHKELARKLQEQLGVFGQLDANPGVVKQYSPTRFAIRTNRGTEDSIILATCFVKSLAGRRIGLYTLKTSGTLRSFLPYLKKIGD